MILPPLPQRAGGEEAGERRSTNSSMSNILTLKPNDTIDIIAPASRCPVDDLPKIQKFIESWGLRCHIPKNIFGDALFSANTDAERYKQLEAALIHSDAKAIWCIRGGYGSMKLIPELTKIKNPTQNKIFIGSSDITALHLFLQTAWGWPTIHGPSLHSAAIGKVAADSLTLLQEMLFSEKILKPLTKMSPLNSLAEQDAIISASIIGGNLSLLQASLGTAWELDARNKILFVEEVNERGYRIDRMFEQLKQANKIQQTAAIILGDFIGGTEPNDTSLVPDAVKKFADACPVPVVQLHDIGHGFANDPLLLGVTATLHTGKKLVIEW